MSAPAGTSYTIDLTEVERRTLIEVLEEVIKETEVELNRTEAFRAHEIVRKREETLEGLLRKVRDARRA